MYAQGWPNVGANIFNADLYGNVGFPGKWSYSQLIEQSKKSSLLNFVTNGYRTTPNIGVYSGTSKTSGHYSFYREEVVANGTNSQITHRDPVAINTQAPQIVDYNVAANHTYRYTAYPTDMNDTVFATTAINPNATGSDPSLVQTPMINWSIAELLPVGPTTDIPSVKKEYQVNKSAVWIFKFNVSTGENSQNIGRDQVTNLAQYNKMAQGKRNYMSGTVSCYLGSELVRCTGEYTEEPRFAPLTTSNKSIAMLKAWRKFVASKNPKLLKDRKGNKYIVQLTSVSDRVDDNVPCQPSFVNFSWQEIESGEDVLITGSYENDTTVSATGSTMQTIKLPTPIIHGAAFIGDTIWNSELDTPAFEDSYHFIFSIENDPLTDYYEWSLTDITSPTNSTGYEKQTVRKENIAPIIIPNTDGSGSLDNVGAFQEGHKYMLRVRGRADNSAIEDSNYYSQVIECKWLWGPNKYLDLQEIYWNQAGSVDENVKAFDRNWGFAGVGNNGAADFVSYSTIIRTITIGSAYNRNTISKPTINWSNSTVIGDEVIITAIGRYRFQSGDVLHLSLYGDFGYANSATRQFGLYRARQNIDGDPQATFLINSINISENTTTFNCTLQQGQYVNITSVNYYPQLWSYSIGDTHNDWDDIYPWSDIVRSCGTWKNGYYQRNAYESQTGFALDGSAGDVFVEFPLFYYGDIKQSATSPDWQFPFKYKTSTTECVIYCTRFVFIAQYPYHYGMPREGVTTLSPVLLPSSMHINYDTEQTYAIGFLSAYELSKINGVYHSVSKQTPVTQEAGVNLLSQISQQQPGLVGLKYTDHNMVCLLMAVEFGTHNINLALSGFLYPDQELLISKENDSCYKITTHSSLYDLYKSYFYSSQRVKLEGGYSVEDTVPYLFRNSGGGLNIGDRENDKLVGGTIAWNQLAKLPTSADWTGVTNRSFADGVATFTAASQYGALKAYAPSDFIDGHKYFFGISLKMAEFPSIAAIRFSFGNSGYNQTSSVMVFSSENSIDGAWNQKSKIVQFNKNSSVAAGSNNGVFVQDSRSSNWTEIQFKEPQVIDLTQMFGSAIADYIYGLEAATAGAGVAYFKKLFPKLYYAYNAGTLESVNAAAHITRGFNQFNITTKTDNKILNWTTGALVTNNLSVASDYIRVVEGQTYYCNYKAQWMCYNFDKEYLGPLSTNGELVPIGGTGGYPTNVAVPMGHNIYYIRLGFRSDQNNNINFTSKFDMMFNISQPNTALSPHNGDYVHYSENAYPLDSSLTLNGLYKLGANKELYCDGDTYESDGTVTRKEGTIRVGDATVSTSSAAYHIYYVVLPNAKSPTTAQERLEGIMSSSFAVDTQMGAGASTTDLSIKKYTDTNNRCLALIRDNSCEDAAAFKTKWANTVILYELATPTTDTADPYTNPQTSTPNGTEEYVDAGVEAGTRDVAIPVGHETLYQNPNTIVEETNQIGAVVPDDNSYTLYLYLTKASNINYQTICPIEWETGATDNLPGSTNSLRGGNNLFAPCKYRGLENPFGNVGKLCSDMRGYSAMSGAVGLAYCYYYKNANAATDPSGTSGSYAGVYFRSNTYVVPTSSGNNIIPIQNSNGATIGSYYIAYANTTPNGTASGYLCQGVVGPFDPSGSWYAIQVGGGSPFTSYLDPSTSCVPNGPFNIDTTQYFTNAAFGTRFSTHRTHY